MKFITILVLISVISGINALSKTFMEGFFDQIQCPQNQIIYVEHAEWTYKDLNRKHNSKIKELNFSYIVGKRIELCTFDVTSSLKNMCDGKSSCEIDGNKIILLSDECDYWMKVIVTYQCVDCSEYETSKSSLSTVTNVKDELKRLKRQYNSKSSLCIAKALSLYWMMLNNNNNRNICPNPVFISKHVCSQCRTNNDIVQFAVGVAAYRIAHGYAPTHLNSVFTGTPTYRQAGTRCIFYTAVPKYDCFRAGVTWNCVFQRNVRATHDLNSGHYDHTQDV